MGYLNENTPYSLVNDEWDMLKTDGAVILKNVIIVAVAIKRISSK